MVAVADLGKVGREDDGGLRISEDGSLGMRLASMGGGAVSSSGAGPDQGERQRAAAEAEEQRHLLRGGHAGGGAPDPERAPRPREPPPSGTCASRCAGSGAASARPAWREGAAAMCSSPEREARHQVAGGGPRDTLPGCLGPRTAPALGAEPRAPGPRAAGARVGGGSRAASAARQPAQLLGPRGLSALLLPLLSGALAEAAPGRPAGRAAALAPGSPWPRPRHGTDADIDLSGRAVELSQRRADRAVQQRRMRRRTDCTRPLFKARTACPLCA